MFPFGKGPGPAELRERQLDPTHLSVKMGPEGVAVRRCCHMHHSLHVPYLTHVKLSKWTTQYPARAPDIVVPDRMNRIRDIGHGALAWHTVRALRDSRHLISCCQPRFMRAGTQPRPHRRTKDACGAL